MVRPCFLVIDREYGANISTRKLVIETAKLNVLTAYSGAEAIEMLKRFPNLDGIVLDAGIEDIPFEELIARLKAIGPKIPTVLVRTPRSGHSQLADYELESFDPVRLLDLLRNFAPEKARAIDRTDERLSARDVAEAESRMQSIEPRIDHSGAPACQLLESACIGDLVARLGTASTCDDLLKYLRRASD